MMPENLNIEKLKKDIITHLENYICSACAESYSERLKSIASASDAEIIEKAQKLNFNLEKYKL